MERLGDTDPVRGPRCDTCGRYDVVPEWGCFDCAVDLCEDCDMRHLCPEWYWMMSDLVRFAFVEPLRRDPIDECRQQLGTLIGYLDVALDGGMAPEDLDEMLRDCRTATVKLTEEINGRLREAWEHAEGAA